MKRTILLGLMAASLLTNAATQSHAVPSQGPTSAAQSDQQKADLQRQAARQAEMRKQAEAKRQAELKKKQKAAERKKAELAKQQATENYKRELAQRRKAASAADQAANNPAATRRHCEFFLDCLFGKDNRKPSGLQKASYQKPEMSERTTRKVVAFNDPKYKVGSLIVRTPERALYYVSAKGEAVRYSIGVGREGFQWSGNSRIVAKQEWPDWRPPPEMIKREAAKGHILPPLMEGGPENPLGARAMYIGGTMFRVHGTNNEDSIGGAVSSGCIRMMNADVIDLYERVKVGSPIYVYQ